MTPEQIKLIKDNWAAVAPIAPQAAEIFYGKLFEANPDLKFLFTDSDMVEQGKKLMQTLGVVVGGLENLEPLLPTVQALGVKHIDYGVKPEDYETVGGALLDTLAAGLGEAFTPEAKEAWTVAYTTVAKVMMDAAASQESPEAPPITVRQKVMVQETWKLVAPIAPQAADIFYEKLFTIDPSLKELFPAEMGDQKNKLMQTLAVAINSLDNLENLIPILQDLGRRHVDYKVVDSQYPTVGQALLETLEAGLGDDFTPEVKEAWTAVYGVVAKVMMDAAKEISLKEEGPISPSEIKRVQESWALVAPIAETAADIFYTTLFEMDPNLKSMFPSEMAEQKKKLMKTLGVAVASLTNLEALIPVLQDLGKGHVAYGAQTGDYNTVGAALLATLEKGLGEAFTPEVKEAWTKVYGIVSSVMIEAATEVPPPSIPPMAEEEPKGFFAKLLGIFK